MPLNDPGKTVDPTEHTTQTLTFYSLLAAYVEQFKYSWEQHKWLSNILSLKYIIKENDEKPLGITRLSKLLSVDKKTVKIQVKEMEKPELKQHILYIKETKNRDGHPSAD